MKEVILAYETLEVYAHVQNAFIMESTLYFLKIQMQRNSLVYALRLVYVFVMS